MWLATGLTRVLSSLDKGQEYYISNRLFLLKMILFVTIGALAVAPMRAFIRWRRAVRVGELPDTAQASAFAIRSTVQAVLVVLMVIAAAGMARGLGMTSQLN